MKVWLPVKEYEGLYEVSNRGEVKGLKRGKLLKPRFHYRYNYKSASVLLHSNGKPKEKQISRLVAIAFIPNPQNKPHVNHLDNDATNNRVENLEWVTHQENLDYASSQNRFNANKRGTVGINYLRNKDKLKKKVFHSKALACTK